MIQAIGLTSLPSRTQLRPVVDDLTFEARPGRVTVLLGPEGSGKSTSLRLMLQLQSGRGTALFRGRPVHRIQYLAREVGVLLDEVNGHPGRTVRGHLRMLAAAAGVSAGRADDVLDVVGLSGLADQRMSALSRGMDRRLGMACVLLGDPHTLVLDEPARDLSPRETAWMHSLLRGYANQGGTALITSHDAEEAAKLADRVVSIGSGRLLADQEAADFARTRLRPRVAVRTPHVDRLVAVLTHEGRRAGKDREGGPLKVVREGGTKVSVYGSSCAEVGEYAYKNNILVHQLTVEQGDAGDAHPPGPLYRADGRRAARHATASPAAAVPAVASRSTRRVSAAVNGFGQSAGTLPEAPHTGETTPDHPERGAQESGSGADGSLHPSAERDELIRPQAPDGSGEFSLPSDLDAIDAPDAEGLVDSAEFAEHQDPATNGEEPDPDFTPGSSAGLEPLEEALSEAPRSGATEAAVPGHTHPDTGAGAGLDTEAELDAHTPALAPGAHFVPSSVPSAHPDDAPVPASPNTSRAADASGVTAASSFAVTTSESAVPAPCDSEAPTLRISDTPLADAAPASNLTSGAVPASPASSEPSGSAWSDEPHALHAHQNATDEAQDEDGSNLVPGTVLADADVDHNVNAEADADAVADVTAEADAGTRIYANVDADGAIAPDADSESASRAASEPGSGYGPATESVSEEGDASGPTLQAAEAGSGDSGAASAPPRRPIVMKPLADPDARGKAKSLWAPRRTPARAAAELPPQLHAVARPGPVAPMRYELCRLFSVRSTWISVAVAVAAAVCVSLVMARTGMGLALHTGDSLSPPVRLLTGWPSIGMFAMPPVAVAAGLLGAFAFGEEFRYPALAPARSPVPRRFSLLAAKLAVSGAVAVLLGVTAALVNAAAVTLFFGSEALAISSSGASGDLSSDGASWQLQLAAVLAFTAGCAWAGVVSSGVFRSGTAGAVTVLAIPLLLAPAVSGLLGDGSAPGRTAEGLPQRLETALLVPWPSGTERWVAAVIDVVSQPVGSALALSLAALLTAYVITAVSGRSR